MTWNAIYLKALPVAERFQNLPEHLQFIVKAAAVLKPSAIWVFGSRARGDARPNSDFDLGFRFTNKRDWAKFVLDVPEDVPSLYSYDLVDVDSINRGFLDKINEEGVLLFEQG